MAELIDAEMRQIIVKKTWCHGQAVLPVYGVCLLWWFVRRGYQPLSLLFPILFLPYWCFLSYRSIFVDYSFRTILMGGIIVEWAHAIVFSVAVQGLRLQGQSQGDGDGNADIDDNHTRSAANMLLCIASGLLFIETAAFLGVVAAFRPPPSTTRIVGTEVL